MDRREQRFKKRTAVTKEQTLNFLCANEAAEQNREAHQCGERNSNGITQPSGAATPAEQRRASCASLFRRLSASFRSASDQDPKAAKFAVLTPGHAGFPKRVKRSEGSDTTPLETSLFRRVNRCVRG